MKQLRDKVAEAIMNGSAGITGRMASHTADIAIQTVLSDPRIVGLVEALQDDVKIMREIDMGMIPKDLTVMRHGELRRMRVNGEFALNAFKQMRSEISQ